MTQSDAWKDLIENAKQGCDESISVIATQMRGYLKSIADKGIASGLQSKISSSDVVQISLIEAQAGIANFRGSSEAELKKWLKRIVMHNMTDEAKRFRRAQSRDVSREKQVDVGALPQGKGEKTPSWHASSAETKQQILNAIDFLPTKQRRVVQARFRDGLDYPEIAKELDVSEAAARQLWSRAAEKLRRMLSPSDES